MEFYGSVGDIEFSCNSLITLTFGEVAEDFHFPGGEIGETGRGTVRRLVALDSPGQHTGQLRRNDTFSSHDFAEGIDQIVRFKIFEKVAFCTVAQGGDEIPILSAGCEHQHRGLRGRFFQPFEHG